MVAEISRIASEHGKHAVFPAYFGESADDPGTFASYLRQLQDVGIPAPAVSFDIGSGILSPREMQTKLLSFITENPVGLVYLRGAGIRDDRPREEIEEYWKAVWQLQKELVRLGKSTGYLEVLLSDPYRWPNSMAMIGHRTLTYTYEGEEKIGWVRGYPLSTNFYALQDVLIESGK